jgi:hypothetical protein
LLLLPAYVALKILLRLEKLGDFGGIHFLFPEINCYYYCEKN